MGEARSPFADAKQLGTPSSLRNPARRAQRLFWPGVAVVNRLALTGLAALLLRPVANDFAYADQVAIIGAYGARRRA